MKQPDDLGWASPERQYLIEQIRAWLVGLHGERAQWRDMTGELICYRGEDERETEGIMRAAAQHYARYAEVFDLGLDWFNDARNPALSDPAAHNTAPDAHREFIAHFSAEATRLKSRIADWRERHAAA